MCEWTLPKKHTFGEVLPAFLGGIVKYLTMSPYWWPFFYSQEMATNHGIARQKSAFFCPLGLSALRGERVSSMDPKTWLNHPSVTVLINLHQEARTNAGMPLRLEACKEFSFMAMLACNTPNNILSMCISEVSCTWLMIGCGCFWKKRAVHGYA